MPTAAALLIAQDQWQQWKVLGEGTLAEWSRRVQERRSNFSTCQKIFKALLFDNENLCTSKQIISNVLFILSLFLNVQVLQNNLYWCIDNQCIDDKTVMHTDVLVYSQSLCMLYSFYVVESQMHERGCSTLQSPLQLEGEGGDCVPSRPPRHHLSLRKIKVFHQQRQRGRSQ